MHSKDHWEKVYTTKATSAVSWFQPHADLSLGLIVATGVGRDASIIDVGGGASTLADDLLANGFTNVSVLDLSAAALAAARERLGSRAADVRWIEADITGADLPANQYDVWHDRAVFHFLTSPEDRAAYVKTVFRSVKPGGYVIVATFAEDGPDHCSGLPVMRYRAGELHAEFGESFTLLDHRKEAHHTPSGTVQQFVYCYCRRVGSGVKDSH
jgi:ubiquinone/menaquinone biosynthesis C-methylase UbiE